MDTAISVGSPSVFPSNGDVKRMGPERVHSQLEYQGPSRGIIAVSFCAALKSSASELKCQTFSVRGHVNDAQAMGSKSRMPKLHRNACPGSRASALRFRLESVTNPRNVCKFAKTQTYNFTNLDEGALCPQMILVTNFPLSAKHLVTCFPNPPNT